MVRAIKLHWCKKCKGRAGLADVVIDDQSTDYYLFKVLSSHCPCGEIYEYTQRALSPMPRRGIQKFGREPLVLPLS